MRFLQICIVAIIAFFAVVNADCFRPCPHNYAPLCGKDEAGTFTTYANDCDMENAACTKGTSITKAYDGECK